MPTPFESAQLNLQLFDLRREPVLREARAWYLNAFTPQTFEEVAALVGGERNASFRMVLGYWDMAASLVTQGAIEPTAFLAAHGEVVATYALVQPFLPQIRQVAGYPEFCQHLEAVVRAMPNAEAVLENRRAVARAAAARRAAGPTAATDA